MKRTVAVAANLALACASLVVVLAAIEATARLLDEPPGTPIALLYTEYDPLLGWRHRPGARWEFPQGSYAINSLGLRDRERSYTSPRGTQRILVLGDSFAEGFSVAFEDVVSQALERNLNTRGCPAEVLNGGTVGYSTDQEYLFYREEGSRYGASIVVLLFYYNDILANTSADASDASKPLVSCDGETLRVLNYPVPAPAARPVPTRPRVQTPYPWHSAALEWVRKRLGAAPRVYEAVAALGVWPPLRTTQMPLEMKVYERRPRRAVRRAWSATSRLLQALKDEVKAHAARLLVVYVPSKVEISERDFGLARIAYGVDDKVWDRGQVERTLGQFGKSTGVPVLDLTKPLRDVDSAFLGGPYHAHGGHWNALGHRVAAHEIERFLREQHWLEVCKPTVL